MHHVDPDFNHDHGNTSLNPHFAQVLQARLSRRHMLRSALGTAGAGLLGAVGLPGQATAAAPNGHTRLSALGFEAVSKSVADTVVVPRGYTARVIYAVGDPLRSKTPAFKNDGTDADFGNRAGDHHDGMVWFGLDAHGQPSRRSTTRGLLAINHEATTQDKLSALFVHADGGSPELPRPSHEIDKEIMLHGISVVEVALQNGQWSYQLQGRLNRRITPLSPALICGPARGSAHLMTRYSPDGLRARGTLNNCGASATPWGTMLSGEENWFAYFHRHAQDDAQRADPAQVQALHRYGCRAGVASRHGWESGGSDDSYARWNASVLGSDPGQDFRHEINTFGYMVELDPYSPHEPLRKRTALGRISHENACFAPVQEGQPVVAYMGDDSRGEYIYKFVSHALWDARDAQPKRRLAAGDKYLDKGKLYVARFQADGTGQWVELSLRNPLIQAHRAFAFKSDADIAIFTRLAADAVGATKMDRPEWGSVNPKNGEIYFTLTNNSQRTVATTDSANPRSYTQTRGAKPQKGNINGHIVRMAPSASSQSDFRWDIYLFAAPAHADKSSINLSHLGHDNDLSSPDGLAFSAASGLCWIQTDDSAYTDETNCMLLAALPGQCGDGAEQTLVYGDKQVRTHVGKPQSTATLKRFLVGPKGAEITGLCETPDGRTLFVNIQHPGENTAMQDIGKPDRFESQWPANAGYGAGQRPRSATIAITKDDGGVIGS